MPGLIQIAISISGTNAHDSGAVLLNPFVHESLPAKVCPCVISLIFEFTVAIAASNSSCVTLRGVVSAAKALPDSIIIIVIISRLRIVVD